MKRLLFAALAFVIACVQAPTALPQQGPVGVTPWTVMFETPSGRTGAAFGATIVDSFIAPIVVETIKVPVPDTIWCNTITGECSKTRPPAPGDTIVPVVRGIPFGPFGQADAPFTLKVGPVGPGNIVTQIDAARAKRLKLLLNMTGGSHDNYMSTINGVYQFDLGKWKKRMDAYNTVPIREAVAKGVADGTIIGNFVMDEPQVSGGTNPDGDGNTWGPPGTMTKARVDTLCGYALAIFPTLPVGAAHTADAFEPTKDYAVCQLLLVQYAHRKGEVTKWRDAQLAYAKRDGLALITSLNILAGGVQDRDGTYDCKGPGQGGLGTWPPLCRMTAQQVKDWGLALAPAGCALALWKYDDAFMAKAANQVAFQDVAAALSVLPQKPCRWNG